MGVPDRSLTNASASPCGSQTGWASLATSEVSCVTPPLSDRVNRFMFLPRRSLEKAIEEPSGDHEGCTSLLLLVVS